MQGEDVTVYWVTRLEADRKLLWKGPSAKPFQVLLMCLDGSLEIRIAARDHQPGPGQVLVFRSDQVAFLRSRELPTRYQWVSFYAPSAQTLPIEPNVEDPSLLEKLFDRLLHSFELSGGQGKSTRFWMQAMLEVLAEDEAASRPPALSGSEDVIRRIIQQIDAHPQQCWSVEELARRAGYSKTHFYRTFKQLTGRGPQQYVIAARIDRAQRLLLETDLSISEIARQLGYQSVFHFSKQFRRRSGLCPSAVRTSRPPA